MDILDQVPCRNRTTASKIINGQAIIVFMDEDKNQESTISVLNQTGSSIWSHIDGKRKIREILDLILEEYDVGHEKAETKIAEFMADLSKRGLIEMARDPESQAQGGATR